MEHRREYLQLLEKARRAIEASIDAFNRVNHPYRNETTLILMTNAWELLAKAVLVRKHSSIQRDSQGNTISAEVAVARLKHFKVITESQEDSIQQIISLRHGAAHHVLPDVADEIMHHLLFFGCKFFRETVAKVFPTHRRDLKDNYLSLSFSDLTTYADKVQKLVSRIKKSDQDKKLAWLLERGIKFDGAKYITQKQFETQYRRKRRIMPHLAISDFIRDTDMVRIIPVQAPRNFTADINLRKGSRRDSSLPVFIKKTEMEADYPYLTKELAKKLNKNQNFIAATVKYLKLKSDAQYHQQVRSSLNSYIHRYSQSALDKISLFLNANAEFNPYLELRKN